MIGSGALSPNTAENLSASTAIISSNVKTSSNSKRISTYLVVWSFDHPNARIP